MVGTVAAVVVVAALQWSLLLDELRIVVAIEQLVVVRCSPRAPAAAYMPLQLGVRTLQQKLVEVTVKK
ncbi:hypothetical protein BDA96_05G201900 [Sorghum bicolor]|uniref:Secreted protein n=1 Tax=Sorghum bicolor TaxID=4558 RepID=A0A921QZW7_SORBI|nr:hypothetical protein BDA96_05G201900 [Sorghum bicolor]